ncbi:MAG: hypothetical protein ABEI75_00620, partial [Halobaculum sp.]
VHRWLPRVAHERGWPITADHCFARVVLDNTVGGVWTAHLDGRPAYRQLSPAQLREAIRLADRMLREGRPAVEALNRKSLAWRGE